MCAVVQAIRARLQWLARAALGLLLVLPAFAQAAQGAPQPVRLIHSAQGVSLVGAMGFLADEQGRLGIDQLRSVEGDARFTYPEGVVHASLDARPFWFKIRVRQEGANGDWLISVPMVAVRELQFFGPYDEAGAALGPPVVTGLAHPYQTRVLGNERFVFRFQPAAPGVYTIYVRAASEISQLYALAAWDTGEYMAASQGKRLFDGMCYGILLGMLLYNLVLLFVFRDRIYVYYLLTCGFAMLSIAGFNGHAARYVFADTPWLSTPVMVAAPALWIAFGALFGRHFLELPRHAPRLDRVVLALVALAVLAALMGVAGHVIGAMALIEIVAMAGTAVMFAGAALSRRRGFRPALWYLAGLAALFASVFTVVLTNWGFLHASFIHLNGLQIGVVTEVVVFAIALGSRIRAMRVERGAMNRRAAVLAEAAQTDPLTGVANRAGLAAHAERLPIDAAPRALMLIDLDHFKPVNDRFGHEAGDAVLVEIAGRLEKQVRPGDTVARLGGDEFVILFDGAPDRDMLETIARRLLEAVAAPLVFRGETLAVGGSVGVACDPKATMDLAALMRAADVAMYHIKARGRAGYAFYEDLAVTAGRSVPASL
ncbi:MAG TPA: diguanylate cyclase [Burkholderiaceae bacterium]|nr:diguanylate cyclase [Burkholderiaceae bacterium]